ncbi:MAG: 50S ribosomal protein L17 [Verrucomicrobia bacterium]|jgi:large subunit ribosomal protein L17|nr:50S ribosomal protein L17 [Verrucomicrobiota bacterium]
MRHLKRTAKLGRTTAHRNAMLANMVCSLIKHKRITTTLAKAKAVRPVAEKVMTLARKSLAREALIRENLTKEGITDEKAIRKEIGKRGGLHYRRLAVADLRQEDAVTTLFKELAPAQKERSGGYTRIIHAAVQRRGDASRVAIIEWVEDNVAATAAEAPAATKDIPAPATVAEVKAEEAKAAADKPAEGEAKA